MSAESDPGGSTATGAAEVAPDPPAAPATLRTRLGSLVAAVRDGDEAMVEEGVLRLSRSRRAFAPLALVVGGLGMLLTGLKLLFTNWRLTLVQILPAVVIWAAMYDLRAHVLRGSSLPDVNGPVLIPIVIAIAAITMASFFLNAVFGFAISQPGAPRVRPAVEQAKAHLPIILGSGAVIGVALGVSVTVVARTRRPWFALTLSIVIGVMMLCYVAIPSRLIGVKPAASKRDRLAASAVAGAVGSVVSAPPYLVGRIGLLMLGVPVLFVPGLVIVAFAAIAQAAATSAVKSVKMSAKLLAGGPPAGNP